MPGLETEHQAQELTGNDKLRWCLENLGQRITTVAVNSDELDASTVRGWADGTIPEPTLPKVSLLYDAAKQVSDVYDAQTARAFLRSSNSYAGDESLLLVIAQAEPEQAADIVSGAVAIFTE
jgi:hypothetical protein